MRVYNYVFRNTVLKYLILFILRMHGAACMQFPTNLHAVIHGLSVNQLLNG